MFRPIKRRTQAPSEASGGEGGFLSEPPQEPAPLLPIPPAVWHGITGVLLFLIVGLQGGGAERQCAVACAVLLAVSLAGPMPQWAARRRISLTACAVGLYFLLNCAAGLYARFGNLAAPEFGKILSAFCVFAAVLLRARRDQLKQLAAAAAAVCAVVAVLSLDSATLGAISELYFKGMDRVFGCNYWSLATSYEAGARIAGIFSNPNVLGGLLAIGTFLSIYLVRDSTTRPGRLAACLLVGINGLTFLLAFSMGALGMFALSAVIYLLAESKGKRLSLFLLLAESGVIILAAAVPAFGSLGKTGLAGAVMLLAAPASGVVLWLVHEFAGRRLADFLTANAKTAYLAAGWLGVALVVYVILAWNITGSYALAPGASLRRSVYPKPGEYTLETEIDGQAEVRVEAQDRTDTVMHTSTVLYQGPAQEAAFTVPEGTRVVYLTFTSPEGAEIQRAALSNGPAVKLGYRLLPGFAANRLQGLWANQNAIQRLAFFQDGLRMFAQSPIWGQGLGVTEGLVHGVQEFYYSSRYVHNHYIQVMAEMGVLGLVSFLFLLGAPAAALWRRRNEGGNLLPALAACLAMGALHALTEVVWSRGSYQVILLFVIGLIAVGFCEPVLPVRGRVGGIAVPAAVGVVCLVFGALVAGNLYAVNAYQEILTGRREETPYSMTELARIDRYNWAQYKLDMAVNAAQSPKEEFASTAARYAEDCRKLRTYSINQSLEQYVYLPGGQYDELFEASQEGIPQAAALAETWEKEFELYRTLFQTLVQQNTLLELNWFSSEVQETYEMLVSRNTNCMEQIPLSAENLQFIDQMLAINAADLNGEDARVLSERLLFDSESAADTDSDGVPDRLRAQTLQTEKNGWQVEAGDTLNVSFVAPAGGSAVLELRSDDAQTISSVTLNGVPVEVQADSGGMTAFLPVDAGVEYQLTFSLPAALHFRALNLTMDL